jgi:proteasome lid subunit RPN8/RPN11
MDAAPKTDSSKESAGAPRVEFAGEVLQQIRKHARSSMRAEICGVLIGSTADGVTRVAARIAGVGASQGGAHVTFTQDTWEHIYKVKDAEFPSQSIVGWYHSHPGFGIFLSDYDLFIHENFFNAQHQVAWVFDPHSDEEGCFGWIGKNVEPLKEVAVIRKHWPPTPTQSQAEATSQKIAIPPGPSVPRNRDASRQSRRIGMTVIVAILAFGGGFVISPYFFEWKSAVLARFGASARPRGPSAPVAPTAAPQMRANSGYALRIGNVVLPSPEPEKTLAPPSISVTPITLPPENTTDLSLHAGGTANPKAAIPLPLPSLPMPSSIEKSPDASATPQAEKRAEPSPKDPAEAAISRNLRLNPDYGKDSH